MMYPQEKGPVWIDWKKAADGGLRVIAVTDCDSEPCMAVVRLDAAGAMLDTPEYQPSRAWYTTQLFPMPDGSKQLWRFVAVLSPEGLAMKAKPVPSIIYQCRALPWEAECPAVEF